MRTSEKEAGWTLKQEIVECFAQGLESSGGKECDGVKALSKM